MSSLNLLLLYSVAIIGASFIGGVLPSRMRLTHTLMQLVMSLVSGLMLGVALFHLLPHGVHEMGGEAHLDTAMIWLTFGLIVIFLLLRMFHFHQHDFTVEDHAHDDPNDHCAHQKTSSNTAWFGVFVGLAIHTLIDGIALGAAITAEAGVDHGFTLAGLGVFLAIVLHKPLDALTITALMQKDGWSLKSQRIINVTFAAMCPLGAALFLQGVVYVPDNNVLVGIALVFSAGVFLCISLSDLLPELQFHSHDRTKLTVLLLLGIVIAYAITGLEPTYHNH